MGKWGCEASFLMGREKESFMGSGNVVFMFISCDSLSLWIHSDGCGWKMGGDLRAS